MSGTSFSTFCAWFFKKNVTHVAFYKLTKFHCLIPFTSRDSGQYVYYDCLLTRMWRHKFEISLTFLMKSFWYMAKKSRQKLKYLENGKSFWREIKSIFHHFWRTFNCRKVSQTRDCSYNKVAGFTPAAVPKNIFYKDFSKILTRGPEELHFRIAFCSTPTFKE